MMNLIKGIFTGIIVVFAFSSMACSQTLYKQDSGFFVSPVESFYLRGGSFEESQHFYGSGFELGPGLSFAINR